MNAFQKLLDLHASSENISNQIDWEKAGNGTGYYDPIQDMVKLPEGVVKAATSPAPNNRRMVIIGHGMDRQSSVFFERYTPNMGSSEVVVSNRNQTIGQFLRTTDSAATLQQMEDFLSFRWEHSTDLKVIEKVTNKIIEEMTTGTWWPNINDKFWCRRYNPARLAEVEAAFDAADERMRSQAKQS